ncbi:glutathione S-transferase family protein [Pseudaestuariivita atlantica]|uniref:Glutathione S-transferase n=1 Tax=Pseudaestuariivita atlantica TaxID=1317121 RepID=A0A0L1JQ48_9RHOB|nr:glutathione S-transferase family protein [Pseudaestuariivita atlantica]KNG93513.1 glutathione S-transferase [Pseudaestuariivita atlantica]
MYRLIGLPRTRTFRVMWLMEELALDYIHEPHPPQSDDVLKASHLGKIPVLIDGEDAISDSVAIMTYLADKHGGCTHPAGTIARARQDAVTNQVIDELDAVLWTAARHSFILPKEHRVPAIKDSLRWEFDRNAERLAARLDGPFIAGDRFTIADILATHCLNWAYSAKFMVGNRALLDYAKEMRARPGYKAADARAAG